MKNPLILILALFSFGIAAQSIYTVQSPEGLKLRKDKSTSSQILRVLPDGENVQVLEKDIEKTNGWVWYKVAVGTDKGYVASEYLRPAMNSPKGLSGVEYWRVNSDNLRLRKSKSADSDANVVATLFKGNEVRVIEKDVEPVNEVLWYMISYGNVVGYAPSQHLSMLNASLRPDEPRKDAAPPAPKDPRQISNQVNIRYWEDGRKIIKSLTDNLEDHFAASTFSSELVAADFRRAGKKLRALSLNGIYPEIQEDVNRKIDYLDFAANKVDGSFSKYGENALKYLVSKIIDLTPELIKKRGYMPDVNVIWLGDQALEAIDKKLNMVNEQESKTISRVNQKYGLKLVRW